MRAVEILRRVVRNSDRSTQSIAEAVQGIANQSDLINRKLEALIQGSDNQSRLLSEKLEAIRSGLANQSSLLSEKLTRLIELQEAERGRQRDEAEVIGTSAAAIGELRRPAKDNT